MILDRCKRDVTFMLFCSFFSLLRSFFLLFFYFNYVIQRGVLRNSESLPRFEVRFLKGSERNIPSDITITFDAADAFPGSGSGSGSGVFNGFVRIGTRVPISVRRVRHCSPVSPRSFVFFFPSLFTKTCFSCRLFLPPLSLSLFYCLFKFSLPSVDLVNFAECGLSCPGRLMEKKKNPARCHARPRVQYETPETVCPSVDFPSRSRRRSDARRDAMLQNTAS